MCSASATGAPSWMLPWPKHARIPIVQNLSSCAAQVEFDVRYIGHWGTFLDASLALAHQRGGLDYESLQHEGFREQGKLPDIAPPGPPDLIMYSYVGNGDKWLDTASNLNLTATWEAFLMVRALAESSMRQTGTPPAPDEEPGLGGPSWDIASTWCGCWLG